MVYLLLLVIDGQVLLLLVEQGKLRWSGRAWSAGQAQSSQFCLESPDR